MLSFFLWCLCLQWIKKRVYAHLHNIIGNQRSFLLLKDDRISNSLDLMQKPMSRKWSSICIGKSALFIWPTLHYRLNHFPAQNSIHPMINKFVTWHRFILILFLFFSFYFEILSCVFKMHLCNWSKDNLVNLMMVLNFKINERKNNNNNDNHEWRNSTY